MMKVIMSHNTRIVHYEGKLFIESSVDSMKRGLWTMTLSCRVHQGCVMYCAQRIIHFRLGWTYEMPFNLSEETSRIKKPIEVHRPTTKHQKIVRKYKVYLFPFSFMNMACIKLSFVEFYIYIYVLYWLFFMLHAHPQCLVQGIQRDLLHHATFRQSRACGSCPRLDCRSS